MNFWINNISWPKVIKLGLLYTLLSFVVHQIEAVLTIKYYLMPQYFGVWSKLMMPQVGPPSVDFFITSIVFSLVTGIGICLIYYYLLGHLPKQKTKRVFYFADLMLGTYLVFFTLPTYLMFNLPPALIGFWFVSAFVIVTVYSWLLVKNVSELS